MNFKSSLRRGLGLIVISMVLSACTILPDSAPMAVYQLPPVSVVAADATPSTPGKRQAVSSLQVDTPYSQHLLDSQRIVVQTSGSSQVSVYQGAQWVDTNPVLVRNRITAVLRQQIPGLIVSTDSTRLQTNWQLKGELEEFQVSYIDGVPIVHIRFNAALIQPVTNRALATHNFAVTQAVNGTQLPEVVLAFGLATDQLAAQLASWLKQQALD